MTSGNVITRSTCFCVLFICLTACSSFPDYHKQYPSFRLTLDATRHYPVSREQHDIPLLNFALSDSSPTVRRNAVLDLVALSDSQPKAARLLDTAIQSDDKVIRNEAALTAGKWLSKSNPQVVETLVQLSLDKVELHSKAARSTLLRLAKWDDSSRSALASIHQREAEQTRVAESKLRAEAEARREEAERAETARRRAAEQAEQARASELARIEREKAEEIRKFRDRVIAQYGSYEAYERRLVEEQIRNEILNRGERLAVSLKQLRAAPTQSQSADLINTIQELLQSNLGFLERLKGLDKEIAPNVVQLSAFQLLVMEVFGALKQINEDIARNPKKHSAEMLLAAKDGLETFGLPVPTPIPRIVNSSEVYDFAQRYYKRLDRRDGEYKGRRHENEVWAAAAQEFERSAEELESMFLEESFRRDGVMGY